MGAVAGGIDLMVRRSQSDTGGGRLESGKGYGRRRRCVERRFPAVTMRDGYGCYKDMIDNEQSEEEK